MKFRDEVSDRILWNGIREEGPPYRFFKGNVGTECGIVAVYSQGYFQDDPTEKYTTLDLIYDGRDWTRTFQKQAWAAPYLATLARRFAADVAEWVLDENEEAWK